MPKFKKAVNKMEKKIVSRYMLYCYPLAGVLCIVVHSSRAGWRSGGEGGRGLGRGRKRGG